MTGGYKLSNLLETLPPVAYAVAYGSGVFKHFGSAAVAKSAKVVDYILAVDDAEEWHATNLRVNPQQYGRFSRVLGGKQTARVAKSIGLGVHFNPYVNVGGQLCKYGIVSTSRLLKDLNEWEHLYLAGRLHKPVMPLVPNEEVEQAKRRSHRAAACAALLLFPDRFTKRQLYHKICSLSYEGDIRLTFAAEDKSKIDNIVAGSERDLDDLYLDELRGPSGAMAGLVVDPEDQVWTQEASDPSSRCELLTCLPRPVLEDLFRSAGMAVGGGGKGRGSSMDLVRSGRHSDLLQRTLAARVRKASIRQALYGVLSTDFVTSAHYLGQKLKKALLTRINK